MADRAKLAIVHEWIDARDGSVKVFEELAATFPDADLYALSRDPRVELSLGNRELHTTVLNHPALRPRRGPTLPLMPLAWRAMGAGRYDGVITSHHAFAHTNRLTQTGPHLVYVHSPARYVWTPEIDGRGSGPALAPVRAALKRVDRHAARRVTSYAANSTAVAARIERFWSREATVIHPPVQVDFFGTPATSPPTRDYLLGAGRWVPYKNLHLVIETADRAGMPVKIAGSGPDRDRVLAAARRATVPVELIDTPSDVALRELYRNAAALVFPTIEDFGIVPVEAQAAGTPVVALGTGGVLDTVAAGVSGILTESLDPHDLAQAVAAAVSLKPADCQANAQRFSVEAFRSAMRSWAAQHQVFDQT
jgi:glycosyltransferase involved in cell wall biosynthesis